ncbi:hypothetical protein O0I10_007685 [Lichtheimia ornata]|uniref:Uncharacterized protein n=1 Tax=Lichtheimia ornata TaxID=688661 RepID=A0AAD7V0V6_9FUNG|nr:uncharacterized protein O0I10_007685 [Lichtheimia ornata]KAJ8656608.1 hypothetical protein O0I10_007685 [Lichtheimia ornata]
MRATERTLAIVIAVAGLLVATNQIVYAQNANCPAQTVFNQCKQNEDNYLRTCKQDEYACLCKWQKAKVSCWDTCPEDSEKETQKTLMMTYCSQPGANVTTLASSVSSMSSKTLSPIPSSSSGSNSASVTPTPDTNTSAAWSMKMLRHDQSIGLLVLVLIMTSMVM